jgi:hypothetical protein
MTDSVEIVRIIFGKKGIARAEGGIVDPQMSLENLAPAGQRSQAFPGRGGLASIAAQIRQSLFAFEDRGHGLLAKARSIGRHVGPISTLRETYFSGTGRISVRLRPEKREPFQPKMRVRFGPARGYCRIHSASSLGPSR